MKKTNKKTKDELRPEYKFDYTKSVRGKYAKRIAVEGSNIVVLDADVAESFRNSTDVNNALRALIKIARPVSRSSKTTKIRKSVATPAR